MDLTPRGLPVSSYSEASFWSKCGRTFKAAGRQVIEKALWLHYAANRPGTPAWAKTTMYGALGYFILPLDAVPDMLPAVGYTDDLAALAGAIATCAAHIDGSVKALATKKLREWGL